MRLRIFHAALLALAACVPLAPLRAQAAAAPPPALFAVRLTTGPAWDTTRAPNAQPGMAEHSANIARMRREGVLVFGARFGELGLMVLRVPDEATARQQFAGDPTIASGVFAMRVDRYQPFAHGTTAYLATPEAELMRQYLERFNRHDADGVAALVAEDFGWQMVADSVVTTELRGRGALRAWLAGYFPATRAVRSEFLAMEQVGPYLTVRERVSWERADGTRTAQQSLAMYEVRAGLIQRAWYYPSALTTPP